MQNVDWTRDDEVALKTFLTTNPKFLANLRSRIPKIEGNSIEARAVSACEHKGGEEIINAILEMATFDESSGEDTPYMTS